LAITRAHVAAENLLARTYLRDLFARTRIIATPQRVELTAAQQFRNTNAALWPWFERSRTKTIDDGLRPCTLKPRTALAARDQKQRFGSTLIGG